MISEYCENKPEFTTFDSNTDDTIVKDVSRQQMNSTRCFAILKEGCISTNSVQTPAAVI